MNAIHGEYCITRSKDILLIHARGPWNVECVKAFSMDYGKAISDKFGQAWADVISLEGESLFTPDAESQLRSGIEYAHSQGLSHVALLFTHSTVQSTSQIQSERLYKDIGIKLRVFSDRDQALAWLKELGFNQDPHQEEAHNTTIVTMLDGRLPWDEPQSR